MTSYIESLAKTNFTLQKKRIQTLDTPNYCQPLRNISASVDPQLENFKERNMRVREYFFPIYV